MTVNDLNPEAISCAKETIQDKRARFVIQDATAFLQDQSYDLIICNPPYIPRPKSVDDNPYEGLSLLRYLIMNAPRQLNAGGMLVTNFSSLSRATALSFCREAGCSAQEVDRMDVPLKVYNVLNNGEWMAYLKKEAGLREQYRRGYDHWHTIAIMTVQPLAGADNTLENKS